MSVTQMLSRSGRIALVCLALGAGTAFGQGTGLVVVSDPVYADIERLADFGVLKGLVLGQRPYSRREIARIARFARERLAMGSTTLTRRLSDDELERAENLLQHIDDRFVEPGEATSPVEPYVALLDDAVLSFTSTDIVRRPFPAPSSRAVNATIDPLDQRRLGELIKRERTGTLELAHRFELGRWLSIQARERVDAFKRDDTTETKYPVELLLASARVRVNNVALTMGRQQLAWGQAENLGLFLASDAPALDGISLTSDHPFSLPGFLRSIGPAQGTVIYAELGESPVRSDSKLLAYKLSIAPNSALEIGGTFMNHFGGEGGRPSSFGNRLVDFLPFVDIFRKHNYVDPTKELDVDSDKLLGMDARVRLDRLAGLTLLGEFLIDDFDVHRLKYFFTWQGSQTFAILLPSLGTPDFALRLTTKHMSPLTYTHAGLTSGITVRGRLMGDELGPDAKSFGARLSYIPNADLRFDLDATSNIYSNAIYNGFYTDASQTHYEVQKVASTPDELRDVFTGQMYAQLSSWLALQLRGGAEHIRNADFQGGRRWDYTAHVALRLLQ